MTAIVSTIFGKGDKDKHGCVIVADKMLSYRDIAVETDGSKLHKLVETDKLKVVIGAAGTAELIEDFVQKLSEKVEAPDTGPNDDDKPAALVHVRDVARLSVRTINEMVRENIDSFLIPYGKKLNDVFSQDTPEDLLAHIGNTIEKKRKTLYRELEVLISGVDEYGAHIFKIEEGDYVPTDSIGYDAVGSGFESANWTLMHRNYNSRKGVARALFMTTYAKIIAEESFGVGLRTDGFIIDNHSIRPLNGQEIDQLRSKINEMTKKEEEIRTKYIEEFENGYNGGEQ